MYACILYSAGLGCFTLFPRPTGDAGPGITYGVPPILDPLNFVRDIAEGGVRAVFQLLFNIVLFVPLGFIARTLLKLKLPLMLALSFAATCLIETAQFTARGCPERIPSRTERSMWTTSSATRSAA